MRHGFHLSGAWLLALASVCFAPLSAGYAEVYIPDELQPWVEWVLHGRDDLDCPVRAARGDGPQRDCVWPGRLQIEADADGGSFRQVVQVFGRSRVSLPGDAASWPLDVTVGDEPVSVTNRNGRPQLQLDPGEHRIAGRFVWAQRPATLRVAPESGLVSLQVEGRSVSRLRVDGDRLWLGDAPRSGDSDAGNRRVLNVYRVVRDGAPATVATLLQLDIAGESRELSLGRVLLPGSLPTGLVSPLPARLEPDGALTVQARPGSWQIQVEARRADPLEQLIMRSGGPAWPEEEIWSYAAAPWLRATDVNGPEPVDPARVGVAPPFRDLPAYRMRDGEGITISVRHRGRSGENPNQLRLNRDVWRHFDGGGFTLRDRIDGRMQQDWRLDTVPPLRLESASTEPEGPLLITRHPDDPQRTGVELRQAEVALAATLRIDVGADSMPAGGWQQVFERIDTTVHLPPGHRLLAVGGADRADSAWISQWTLLDFFAVLVVAVAVLRLFGIAAGGLALVTLVLTYHETGAPMWSWLVLLAVLALHRYLPEGRARRAAGGARYGMLGVVLLLALPFAAGQLRLALYPQLERSGIHQPDRSVPQDLDYVRVPAAESIQATGSRVASDAIAAKQMAPGAPAASEILSRYESGARLQTGPGIPDWRWHAHRLAWAGPVLPEQTFSLWILPPPAVAAWRFGSVAAVFGLLLMLAVRGGVRGPRGRASGAAAILVCVSLLPLLLSPDNARAETPSQELLQALEARLTAPPDCFPDCTSVERARLQIGPDRLSMDLIVHAAARSAVDLPGNRNGWFPDQVRLDGAAAEALRMDDGVVWMPVSEGVHRLRLSGELAAAATVTVSFPAVPKFVEVSATGWTVAGLVDGRLPGGAVELIRQREDAGTARLESVDVEQFPMFFTVERRVILDLDWRVETRLVRSVPPTAAVSVRVPLLPGESVTTPGARVDDGAVLVSLGRQQREFRWSSVLERRDEITLTAPADAPWQESWWLQASPAWRLAYAGVPATGRSAEATWAPHFAPWPGESLTLSVSRPPAVDGATLAIDRVLTRFAIGPRAVDTTMELDYRATRGGQHRLGLPEQTRLMEVLIDGRPRPLTAENGGLVLPVEPGDHSVVVRLRREQALGRVFHGPVVDLGMPASNLTIETSVPANRWILRTDGPALGPAVLYWSELLALALGAVLLARIGATPLRFHHWLLLGLGFSTFSWLAFGVVAAALLALGARARRQPASPWAFDAMQVAIVGLALAAFAALMVAIPNGLLGQPDMHIRGNGSWGHELVWFADRTASSLPGITILSVPLWVYKALILAWALWLAFALLRWLPWMWRAITAGGFWRPLTIGKSAQRPEPESPSA